MRQLYSDIVFFISTQNKLFLWPFKFISGKVGKLVTQILESNYFTMLDWFLRKSEEEISLQPNQFISPCAGKVLQSGKIKQGQIIYSPDKNIKCNIAELLNESELNKELESYKYFSNIYLSPFDYHYFVSPSNMSIKKVKYIPGKIKSVDEKSQNKNKKLFIQNERYVIECESNLGKFIIVPIGAIGVGSIYLNCYRRSIEKIIKKTYFFKNLKRKKLEEFEKEIINSTDERRNYSQGQPFGFFMFGSTIVILSEFQLNKMGEVKIGDSLKI